ncbi:hypothetical protein ACCS63_37100, partial [Rhizobium brockwellii]|uniref:hypothetical protein n=1 Tax=Rhizobium brockwellii TaxID=3019932 RepID=UPI003F997131
KVAEDPIIPICKRSFLRALTGVLLVGACWSVPALAAVEVPRSPLSAYLAARVAASEGRATAASGVYAIALAGWPDD